MKNKIFLLVSLAIFGLATATQAQVPSYVPSNGLIGWYPFSGNANNHSTNHYNGIDTAATKTMDRYGDTASAYSFNGMHYIILDSSANQSYSQGITFSAWINASDTIYNASIVDKMPFSGGGNYGFRTCVRWDGEIWATTGTYDNGEGVAIAQVNYEINRWYHVVGTYTLGDSIRIYINGVLANTAPSTLTSLTSNTDIEVGSGDYTFGYEAFYGSIDEVGVWNRALTPAEVMSLFTGNVAPPAYVPSNGLLAWYPLDGNGHDFSLNHNHAFNSGATYTNNRHGDANAAADFNGSADMHVNKPTFSFRQNGKFSLSTWVKRDTTELGGIIMMTDSWTTNDFSVLLVANDSIRFLVGSIGTAWEELDNCPVTQNTWDNVIATYDSNTMKLYKNGVYFGTKTVSFTNATTAVLPLYIGSGMSGGSLTGQLDDIGIWNRVLTPSEISALQIDDLSIASNASGKNSFINVYPNPANSNLTLELSSGFSDANVQIFNALGALVYKQTINEPTTVINMNAPAGIYFVKVSNREKMYTQKLIIE
jgi:hypothetical protein